MINGSENSRFVQLKSSVPETKLRERVVQQEVKARQDLRPSISQSQQY
jgi:hypothetical protein